MACNFKSVLASANQCKENPAGLSSFMYVVRLEDYTVEINDDKNEYTLKDGSSVATSIMGFRVDFKNQTGQVTSESNGVGKAWTHTGTGRVELNEDDMAVLSRTLHNSDKFLCLFPTGNVVNNKTEWKVVGNPMGDIEFTTAADTGQSRGDDHGTTFTVICPYQVYDVVKWYGEITNYDESSSH